MKIQIGDLKGKSAFSYCRKAMEGGVDPNEDLEVYCDNILAYRIKSIRWGAAHVLHEYDKGGFRLREYKPFPEKIHA